MEQAKITAPFVALNEAKQKLEESKKVANKTGINTTSLEFYLSELYSNTLNQIFLLRILSDKIQRLLNIKGVENNYRNLDDLLGASKPPIFWKEKPMVKKQITIWSLNDLKTTMHEINNIEILCKKNPQISKIIFFNFFSKLCKKANNFS